MKIKAIITGATGMVGEGVLLDLSPIAEQLKDFQTTLPGSSQTNA